MASRKQKGVKEAARTKTYSSKRHFCDPFLKLRLHHPQFHHLPIGHSYFESINGLNH
jgi:hypothetical protein